MNRLEYKKFLAVMIVGIGCLGVPFSLAAQETDNEVPEEAPAPQPVKKAAPRNQPAPTPTSNAPSEEAASVDCTKDLLLSFFPKEFVEETLSKYDVPKDQWAAITKELANKDPQVIKIVTQKAKKMDPNPLKDPSQRQAAVKLFKETLFQIFSEVLTQHGVKDPKQIQAMLDDVQQQKAKRFAQCMEQQKNQNPPSGRPGAKDEEDEDDSDDDDKG